MFRELTNLKFLDVGNNKISFIGDGTFNSMSILDSLKLNNNTLSVIDDYAFSELKLMLLDLSCNRLHSDNFLWAVVGIDYLNLTYNDFKELNASVFENIAIDLWGGFWCLYSFFNLYASGYNFLSYRKSFRLWMVGAGSNDIKNRSTWQELCCWISAKHS